MKVETLNNRRRDDRIAAGFGAKSHEVTRSLFAADSLDAALKRVIQRNFFELGPRRRPFVQRDARQLANSNLGILQRRRLRVQTKVETVRIVILVDENLRALFR